MLSEASRSVFDQAIKQSLLELVENTGARKLAAFWPFDGEPDLEPAMEALSDNGVLICLPLIIQTSEDISLEFHSWSPDTVMTRNRFGIPEPVDGDVTAVTDLDLLLMPLVAWDESGHRLGMGSGYYDRVLSSQSDSCKPLRIGIAYELQKTAHVPSDAWDIPMHHVITEKGRFTCRP